MAERPAVNCSPLLFFSKAGLLDLLQIAGPELVVPRPVFDELNAHGASDPSLSAIKKTDWLIVIDAPEAPPPIQAWDLGPGESSVLAWGYAHPGTLIILDDLAARRCAASLASPCRGSLGIVLRAKTLGRIPLARPIISALRATGMYLWDRVVNQALRLVDE